MMMMIFAFWAEVGYSSTSSSVFSRRKEETSPGFVQRSLGVRLVGFVVQLNDGRWCGCAAGSVDTGWRGVLLGRFCFIRNLKMRSNNSVAGLGSAWLSGSPVSSGLTAGAPEQRTLLSSRSVR